LRRSQARGRIDMPASELEKNAWTDVLLEALALLNRIHAESPNNPSHPVPRPRHRFTYRPPSPRGVGLPQRLLAGQPASSPLGDWGVQFRGKKKGGPAATKKKASQKSSKGELAHHHNSVRGGRGVLAGSGAAGSLPACWLDPPPPRGGKVRHFLPQTSGPRHRLWCVGSAYHRGHPCRQAGDRGEGFARGRRVQDIQEGENESLALEN